MDWGGGGVEIFLVTSCYRNKDKLWTDGPTIKVENTVYND